MTRRTTVRAGPVVVAVVGLSVSPKPYVSLDMRPFVVRAAAASDATKTDQLDSTTDLRQITTKGNHDRTRPLDLASASAALPSLGDHGHRGRHLRHWRRPLLPHCPSGLLRLDEHEQRQNDGTTHGHAGDVIDAGHAIGPGSFRSCPRTLSRSDRAKKPLAAPTARAH